MFLLQIGNTYDFVHKTLYKLELQNPIYSLIGQIPKRDTVSIYRIQHVSRTTNSSVIKKCEKDELPKPAAFEFESSKKLANI